MERRTALPHIPRKNPGVALSGYRFIFLEIGLIVSLSFVIGVLRTDVRFAGHLEATQGVQSTPAFVVVLPTMQRTTPKLEPPPRPAPPVELAGDVALELEPLNIDAEINIAESAPVPPPPPLAVRTPEPGPREAYVIVEQMPVMIGGMKRLNELLRYPADAVDEGQEGLVVVEFFVEVDGRTSGATVVKSAGGTLDKIALDAIKKLEFVPGEQRDIPVRVKLSLPVRFKLVSTRLV